MGSADHTSRSRSHWGRRCRLVTNVCCGIFLLLILAVWDSTGTLISFGSTSTVIISEIAWSGTGASTNGEWIELYNHTDDTVVVTGWELTSTDSLSITLSGSIPGNGFFLLERINDSAVFDVPADQIFIDNLADSGDEITLTNSASSVVDTANSDGGEWPAGTAAPTFRSMERISPDALDVGGWISHSGQGNGIDSEGNPISGTPGQPNSGWSPPEEMIDLEVILSGPSQAAAGSSIFLNILYQNIGSSTATNIFLTAIMPDGLTYLSDDSGQTPVHGPGGSLKWSLQDLKSGESGSFDLELKVDIETRGTQSVHVSISASETDIDPEYNTSSLEIHVIGPHDSLILIDALLYDGYENQDADEAVHLINLGSVPQDLTGWQLTDNVSTVTFPGGSTLKAGDGVWLARNAAAFKRQFGFNPDYYSTNSAALVKSSATSLEGTWPGFSNDGDEVLLLDLGGFVIDTLVYKAGRLNNAEWSGDSVVPYTAAGLFGEEGQILYRRRNPSTGTPVDDTNSAADWSSMREDIINGRKIRYPGWDLDRFFSAATNSSSAQLQIAIAPDNAFAALSKEIDAAKSSIYIEIHTFRSYAIAKKLITAAERGVEVIVLIEGSPVTGIEDAQKLNCQLLEESSGQCWFMIRDDSRDLQDRYRYLHAKFMIVDDDRAIISSENLSPDSLPDDAKSDGTKGRRGVLLMTDAPGIITGLKAIWESDFDPLNHQDLQRWRSEDPTYGAPAPNTQPITITGGTDYEVAFPRVQTVSDAAEFILFQSPENSLKSDQGLLALFSQAKKGDTILAQQLKEDLHWGPSNSSRHEDPNPRLEAMINAAQRGAKVRIMLDGYYSPGGENSATCDALNMLAQEEHLFLECTLANPSGSGLHNKMFLIQLEGHGYVHVGSINGTEQSHKGNREVALQFQSNQAYQYLKQMFEHDWPHKLLFPVINNDFLGQAGHLLISEIYYDPPGLDDAEFIEITNPTGIEIDLGNFSIGDALNRTDFEDVRRFPMGTALRPGQVVLVSFAARSFSDSFGFGPDFEIIETDPDVPNLVDDPLWGDPSALLQLGNQGDEVLLRDISGRLVDGIAYGDGQIPGQPSCPLVIAGGRALERSPYWRDTDNCPRDFFNWPQPSPGTVR